LNLQAYWASTIDNAIESGAVLGGEWWTFAASLDELSCCQRLRNGHWWAMTGISQNDTLSASDRCLSSTLGQFDILTHPPVVRLDEAL